MNWGDALAVLGGLVGGVLSGTIGIGGGQAFIPIMTIGFRFSQPLAQGTSLAAIVPTAAVGGITHWREGNVVGDVAIWMGVGGVGGGVLGALVAVQVPGPILARGFGVFLLVSAWRIAHGAWKANAAKPQPPS